jgi:membrane protease YdiL (CAAX protease family)
VPLFLAVLTAAGVLYGYLRDASGSLWPVVIAHGTFNAVLGVLGGRSGGGESDARRLSHR